MAPKQKKPAGYWEPLGRHVLIKKDADKKTTKGGIALPDSSEILQLTGRLVKVSRSVREGEGEALPIEIEELDRVIFSPKSAVPVDFEEEKEPFLLVHIDNVIAVWRNDDE